MQSRVGLAFLPVQVLLTPDGLLYTSDRFVPHSVWENFTIKKMFHREDIMIYDALREGWPLGFIRV